MADTIVAGFAVAAEATALPPETADLVRSNQELSSLVETHQAATDAVGALADTRRDADDLVPEPIEESEYGDHAAPPDTRSEFDLDLDDSRESSPDVDADLGSGDSTGLL
ncbi:hypothetical protein [Rhodococcoides corynebacterioides]|uniref:hypothetical protein n=1 Tax=Rhodococcoides corynebacterioides TaxID=53972 RepID=UPI001C9B6B48|nr:hypothetical protein [Rhodococcus corynebacterioides]MBY6361516.1 hypothetical protein [Rhodococcus corynebacterioides]